MRALIEPELAAEFRDGLPQGWCKFYDLFLNSLENLRKIR